MSKSENKPKTDEEIDKFKQDYENYSLAELGEMYGVNKRTIINWSKGFNCVKKVKTSVNGRTKPNLSTLPSITKIIDNSLSNFKMEDHPDLQKMITEFTVMSQQKSSDTEVKTAELGMQIMGYVSSKGVLLGDVLSSVMTYLKLHMEKMRVKILEKNKEKDLDQDYLVALKRRLIDSFLDDVKSLVDEPDRIEFMRILTVAVKRQVKKTIKEMNIPEIVDVNTPIEKAIEIMRRQGKMPEEVPDTIISWQEFKEMFPENVIQDFKL